MKTPENILPLTPHSSQRRRETWNDRAIWCREKKGGDKCNMVRQTERYTTCGAGSSLYAKPCAALNNRYVRSVCVKGNDPSRGLAEWSRTAHSPAWKAYLQKCCTTWKESIYLIWVNLLIMNLGLSSQLRHSLSWSCTTQQQHSQGLSVSAEMQRVTF